MLSDLRYAMRALVRSPLFTVTTVATLALAIGANVTVGSAVDRVLFHPLDLPDLGRVVVVHNDMPILGLRNFGLDVRQANWVFARTDLFSVTGSSRAATATLTGTGAPQQIDGAVVMGAFFDVLGARPALGRLPHVEDQQPGRAPVVVLSDALWREITGGDPAIIGRSIMLDDVPHEVIGVLRRGEELPRSAMYWEPRMLDARALQDPADAEFVVGRPRPNVSFAQVADAMRTEAQRWRDRNPEGFDARNGHTLTVFPFIENFSRDFRPIVMLVFAAVTFMLLIACVNVAGVQLVRTTANANELGIRSALGASRWRLLRRSLSESLLLAVLGGVTGLTLGVLGINALRSWHPEAYPALADVRFDTDIIWYTLGVTMLVGCAVALIPGMRTGRIATRGASIGHDRQRVLRGIAVVQVAFTLVLLLGSGLMIRSVGAVLRVDPGFDAARVYAGHVKLSPTRYATPASRIAFFNALETRLRGLPGVTAAGAALGVPFAEMEGASNPFDIVGRPAQVGVPQHALIAPVTPGYFAAMGIPVRAGRTFTDADGANAAHVVVIDEDLARHFFPGIDPVGRRIIQWDTTTIIGVVSDVGFHELGHAHKTTIYYPHPQNPASSMMVVIRTAGDVTNPAGFLQSAVSGIDRDVPVSNVASMRHRIDASVETRRATMIAVSAFAAASLALAVLGLYGVVSYGTTVRTHEFGIRMALGATAGGLLALVMRGGVALVAMGLVVGLALFLGISRLLSSFLYGIGPHDPLTLIGCAIVLAICTMLACWLPARRAASTDPMVALRDQF